MTSGNNTTNNTHHTTKTTHHGEPAEISLERYLKCGVGVCGSCSLDGTGWRVCKEGPVFTLEELKRITEFGMYKRDGSGRRMKI